MSEKKRLIKHVNTIEYRGRSERHKQDYIITDYTLNRDGSSKRWLTSVNMANTNVFFMSMCDKLSKGEIVDMSLDITYRIYSIYPNVDAMKSMDRKYGYENERFDLNKKGYLTVSQIANSNAFFFNMCEILSQGEIIDLSMDITKRIYGVYPNVDIIKVMAKKYGYDAQVKSNER